MEPSSVGPRPPPHPAGGTGGVLTLRILRVECGAGAARFLGVGAGARATHLAGQGRRQLRAHGKARRVWSGLHRKFGLRAGIGPRSLASIFPAWHSI